MISILKLKTHLSFSTEFEICWEVFPPRSITYGSLALHAPGVSNIKLDFLWAYDISRLTLTWPIQCMRFTPDDLTSKFCLDYQMTEIPLWHSKTLDFRNLKFQATPPPELKETNGYDSFVRSDAWYFLQWYDGLDLSHWLNGQDSIPGLQTPGISSFNFDSFSLLYARSSKARAFMFLYDDGQSIPWWSNNQCCSSSWASDIARLRRFISFQRSQIFVLPMNPSLGSPQHLWEWCLIWASTLEKISISHAHFSFSGFRITEFEGFSWKENASRPLGILLR